MAAEYRLTLSPNVAIRNADETLVFLSEAENANTMAYQAWIAAGNVSDPFVPPPVEQTVLSQDLMAQFTAADTASVQTAIAGNASLLLLWYSLLAQRDPMGVTNARFLSGWSALVSVLGQSRMNAIATALNVPSLVV